MLEPSARLLDRDGVLAVAYATDWPSTRQALRTGDDLEAARWVEVADGFLSEQGTTACIFTRVGVDDEVSDELAARGYFEYETTPEMVCRAPVGSRPLGPNQQVKLVDRAAEVHQFADVAARSFTDLGIPEGPSRALLDHPDVLLGSDVVVALGLLDGEPVAGALCLLVGDEPNGYVGWVSCLEAGRGQGLGDQVTRLVTDTAFERGAGIVTLEASRFGEAIYRRMGYDERYRYRLMIKL